MLCGIREKEKRVREKDKRIKEQSEGRGRLSEEGGREVRYPSRGSLASSVTVACYFIWKVGTELLLSSLVFAQTKQRNLGIGLSYKSPSYSIKTRGNLYKKL